MNRYFNITGCCNPQEHYMVNLDSRLAQIKKMVDRGQYFSINKGRQYGKTTILKALREYLKNDYVVISMDFQFVSTSEFATENSFVKAFARLLWSRYHREMPSEIEKQIKQMKSSLDYVEADLFVTLSEWCEISSKPIVLMIDEVDSASNNQVFLDFLAQLRGYYLERTEFPTFQSVILAGVHDIRNLRQKIRPDAEHKHNSPWNIASNFDIDMSFSVSDIAGMLTEYEQDHHTGMDIQKLSQLIYDYTSGYPVLVSSICKYMDENQKNWTSENLISAVKAIIVSKIPLFESLINKLEDDQQLCNLLYRLLFQGEKFLFSAYDSAIQSAVMYGFVKNQNGSLEIANRIFETVIYDWFISSASTNSPIFSEGVNDKNQFIQNGRLNMEKILEKFILHFNDIYGSQPDKFKEEDGRKLFLLYLRPIINGTGNYYIEAQTRDQKRTDVIIDYLGKQYIIELKIWRGEEYNMEGEKQIAEYLNYYHLEKGYLLSFNFNKNKKSGMKTIQVNGKTVIEAVV
ncbi:MAG: GxxExxY protein [Ruminococcus sp.]|nr:GxxExxY protein [Ruminococcus sp.]